jgi:small subunit ribosomal protein S13
MVKNLINRDLTSSYGVNKTFLMSIYNKNGFNPRLTPKCIKKFLHLQNINFVRKKIILNRKLRLRIKEDLLFLKSLKNYRGIKHSMNLPTRGQRTHTNAKTKKRLKN